MTEKMDSYEYEERAAIRRFDGGIELFEANQLALIDVRDRVPLEKARQQLAEQRSKARQQQSNPNQEKIEELQRQRTIVRKAMMTEKDPEREAELKAKWLDLCTQIIELKKGAKR